MHPLLSYYWNPFSIYCLLMLIHKISIFPNAQYKRFSKVTKDKVSPYAPSSGLQVWRRQNFRLFVASGILIKFDILRRPQHLKKITHYIWHYLVTSKKFTDFFQNFVAFYSEYLNFKSIITSSSLFFVCL